METEKLEARNPRIGEWFRISPDLEYRSEEWMARDDEGNLYLVAPKMVAEVTRVAPDKLHHVMIFLAANQDGENFLWPVLLPIDDSHPVYMAMEQWIQIEPV